MGRNIRRHSDSNTAGTVDQKIGEAGRKHTGLFAGFIKVRIPVNRFLINIAKHLIRNFGKARFRVSIGSGRISINRTKVSVSIHQHIPHGKILCKTDHRIIDGGISVRMVVAQDIANAGSRFFKRFIRCQTAFIHRIKDSAVHGLQAVTHIRKSTGYNNRHCIVDIALLHFADQIRGCNDLIWKSNIFRLVISFMCHKGSP